MSIRQYDLNTLKLNKGLIKGNRFPLWDSVKNCNPECELHSDCTYSKKLNKFGEEKKCSVQTMYMRSALSIILDNLPEQDKVDEYVLSKIGLILMPMYKQLITMKMVEQSLKKATIGEEEKVKVHPVYKEIRLIVKEIDKLLIELGLNANIKTLVPGKKGRVIDPDIVGDNNYYEDMQGKHEERYQKEKKHDKMKAKKIKSKKRLI